MEILKDMLAKSGFVDIVVENKDNSDDIIRSWNFGEGVEQTVFSAYIRAKKPSAWVSSCRSFSDLPSAVGKERRTLIPYIDYSLCVGCGACVELYPMFFVIRDERVWVTNHELFVYERDRKVAYCCPFGAITVA